MATPSNGSPTHNGQNGPAIPVPVSDDEGAVVAIQYTKQHKELQRRPSVLWLRR